MEDLTAYIQGNEELNEEEKSHFLKQLQDGKDPEEVMDEIEDKLQGKIEDIFISQGVGADENDPEYQVKKKEMEDQIASAEAEFNQTMSEIEKETDQVYVDTSKEIDEVKLEEVRSKISGNE